MKLNEKPKEPEVITRYSCSCGCVDLNVEVKQFMTQMKDGTLDPLDYKALYNAKMTCTRCGISGPGFIFEVRTKSKDERISWLIDYLQKNSEDVTFDEIGNMLKCLVIKPFSEVVQTAVDTQVKP